MSGDTGARIATPSQTVGPFFAFGLTTNRSLGQVTSGDASAARIRLRVRVLDGHDQPVPDAMVELWQAAGDGRFLFGRLDTDADGACVFDTERPAPAGDGRTSGDAAHINLCVFMRGLLRHLYTRVYFSDDAHLDRDAVLAFVPEDRRRTLVAHPVQGEPAAWSFDVRLQGDRETVYFDV